MVSASRCREPLSSDIGLRTSVVQLSPRARLANLLFALVVAGTFGAEALYAQTTIRVDDSTIAVSESGTVDQDVWLLSQPSGDVTISLTITNEPPALVTMNKTSLTFTPSNWNTKQTVTFSGVNDDVDNTETRSATIKLTASGADYDGVTATFTIRVDDDEPTKSIRVPSSISVNENSTVDQDVSLATEPTGDVTITLANQHPTLVTMSTTSLTFTPSNWNTKQTVTFSGVDNMVSNPGTRPATIKFTASGADYDGLTHTLTINVNDDEPRKAIRFFIFYLPVLESGTADQDVWLTTEPTGDVTITLANQHPTLVTMNKTSLTFTPSNWNTKQTVTFSGVDNMVFSTGRRQSATIKFTASGADYDGLTSTRIVDVFDDEPIPRTLSEGSTRMHFYRLLVRSGWPPIVVNPTSSDPSVVTVTPAELTWTQATSNQLQSITITAVDNAVHDAGPVTISLPINMSLSPPRLWLPLQSLSITVEDNDPPAPPPPPPPPPSDPPEDPPPSSSEPFVDLVPVFADTARIADLVVEVDQAIDPQTLPTATGGDGVLRYSLSDNLPEGLVFNAARRQLWGTPTVETDSAAAMIYKVLDADADFDTLMFTITVTPPDLKPTFGDAMITDLFAEVDQSVAWPLPEATGGDGVLRYSLSNQPAGLVLSADARQVRGAATATDTTVAAYTARDADGDTATLMFTVTIIDPNRQPTFGDATIAALFAEVDQAIDPRTLPAASGGNGPLAYSLSHLPAGLAFNADTRQVRGAATATDTTVATYTVTDADGDAATLPFTITVIDPDLQPTFGTATIEPLTATACQVVTWPLPAATGGDGALAYSLSNLPVGLVFNADTRQVRGTPTVLNDAGQTITYEGTYTVTDADGDAATLPFTITVHVGLDAPEWMRAENYLGADRTGSWDGLVLLTWALSKEHALVDAYRIYREVRITHSTDAHGRVVALDAPYDEFIPWAKVEAIPGVSVGSTIVPTLDYRATRWAVAAECGGQRTCFRVAGDPESGCGVGCPQDPPEWVFAEDYRGADRTGGWRGSVLLTWPLSKEHAVVDAYRIYREVQITHSTDEHGQVVELDEPRDEFIPWKKVDAVAGATVGSTIVPTLDYRATRWAVAAECGGQRTYLRVTSNRVAGTHGAARAKAGSPEARLVAHDGTVLLPEAFVFAQQGTAPPPNSQTAQGVQSAKTATQRRVGSIDHRTPAAVALGPNYPNPFNPATTIQYALSHPAEVRLTIHNVLGQVVRTLAAEPQQAGRYAVPWDGRDDHGQPLSAGIYFYRLQAGSVAAVEKMVLLK